MPKSLWLFASVTDLQRSILIRLSLLRFCYDLTISDEVSNKTDKDRSGEKSVLHEIMLFHELTDLILPDLL